MTTSSGLIQSNRDVFSQGASQPYLFDQHGLTPQANAKAIIQRIPP